MGCCFMLNLIYLIPGTHSFHELAQDIKTTKQIKTIHWLRNWKMKFFRSMVKGQAMEEIMLTTKCNFCFFDNWATLPYFVMLLCWVAFPRNKSYLPFNFVSGFLHVSRTGPRGCNVYHYIDSNPRTQTCNSQHPDYHESQVLLNVHRLPS